MDRILSSTSLTFKSGLTRNLVKDFKKINVSEFEADFRKLGTNANFLNSKSLSGSITIICDVLNDISGKYHLPLDYQPRMIRVFKKEEGIEKFQNNLFGFCNVDTKKVLKNELPFVAGTIFLRKMFFDSVIFQDLVTTYENFRKSLSSSHFLAIPLHEWFHSIHLDLIYKKYGYEGNCPIMKQIYHKPCSCGLKKIEELDKCNISKSDKFYLNNFLGTYPVNQSSLLEIFAEFMTKITTKSLDEDLNIIKNPLDNIPKDFPVNLKKFLEETLDV